MQSFSVQHPDVSRSIEIEDSWLALCTPAPVASNQISERAHLRYTMTSNIIPPGFNQVCDSVRPAQPHQYSMCVCSIDGPSHQEAKVERAQHSVSQ